MADPVVAEPAPEAKFVSYKEEERLMNTIATHRRFVFFFASLVYTQF
jgi:hypothetical protein